jgi:glycosyltransferase involved in cell wall biosynthesis
MANNKLKTILYIITQTELGGAQTYVYDLAKNLKNDFNIFVAGGEQGKNGEIAKKIMAENISFYEIPHLIRSISPINDFLAIIEIIKLVKKIKPDIIHLNSSKASILGSIAAKVCYVLRVPCYVIYTAHGWVFNEPMPNGKRKFYKYAEKFTSYFKNTIICVSEFDRQTAIKEKIAPAKKLITIHNGIKKIDFLSREQAREILSKKSKIENQKSEIIIGSIGNLYKTKGFEYLIEAIYILITNYQLPITTIIIGDGQEKNNLEDLIGQYNLKNKAWLTGRIDNASQYLKAFNIYICSSVKEGLSYTVMEAMQAGLPIIATSIGGNPELISDYETGLLVKANKPTLIAEKIIELLNNNKLQKKLGVAASEEANKNFFLEKTINKTKQEYINLTKGA